jgi:hypothetical protein
MLTSIGLIAQSSDSANLHWTLLPDSHLVSLFTADSRAHRMSLQKPFGDNGYIFSMGGIFPIVGVKYKKRAVQFSAATSIYSTLKRWTKRGLVENVDFFVDLYLDIYLNPTWAIRTGAGHTSQHLSDDALLAGLTPINYVRDYSQFFVIRKSRNGMVYAGLYYNDNFKTTVDLSPKLIYELGFEQSVWRWFNHNALYIAADIKFRGEVNYKTSQQYQLGYKYQVPNKRAMRVALSHSRGMEDRGQFYTQTRSMVTLGVFLDF